MSSTFGIAGSAPLADYTSRINVQLMDAIKNSWDSVVYDNVTPPLPYPAQSDIIFGNSWFTSGGDIEMIFKQNFEDMPKTLRGSASTDGRFQEHIITVDVHIGIRSEGLDVESPLVATMVNALDKIISLNSTTLIPNANVVLASTQLGPSEKLTSRETWWHVLCKCRVVFWKVRTS